MEFGLQPQNIPGVVLPSSAGTELPMTHFNKQFWKLDVLFKGYIAHINLKNAVFDRFAFAIASVILFDFMAVSELISMQYFDWCVRV